MSIRAQIDKRNKKKSEILNAERKVVRRRLIAIANYLDGLNNNGAIDSALRYDVYAAISRVKILVSYLDDILTQTPLRHGDTS